MLNDVDYFRHYLRIYVERISLVWAYAYVFSVVCVFVFAFFCVGNDGGDVIFIVAFIINSQCKCINFVVVVLSSSPSSSHKVRFVPRLLYLDCYLK